VLRLTADDSALSSSDDVTVTVNSAGGGGGGSITASVAVTPATVDLTSEGSEDWAHWGLTSATSFNHKSGVAQQISNFTKVGGGTVKRVPGVLSACSWTDGTPTQSVAGTQSGVILFGIGNGFQITAPADVTEKTLRLYVAFWMAHCRLEVSLSDGSAPVYVDTSLNNNMDEDNVRVFTISYRAGSSGQQVQVKWTMINRYHSAGNVGLRAATLIDGLPQALAFYRRSWRGEYRQVLQD
jgi:hypothetical protein